MAGVRPSRGPSSARGSLALTLSAAALVAAWPAAAQRPLTESPRVRLGLEPMTPVAWARPASADGATAPTRHPLPPAASGLELQSQLLAFGAVAADEARERPEAIRVRVVSESPWILWLTCGGVLVEGQGRRLPASRLAWRGDGGVFQRLQTGMPVLVARGPATGLAGEPVSIDLRLEIDDLDPVGGLRADLRLQLAN